MLRIIPAYPTKKCQLCLIQCRIFQHVQTRANTLQFVRKNAAMPMKTCRGIRSPHPVADTASSGGCNSCSGAVEMANLSVPGGRRDP